MQETQQTSSLLLDQLQLPTFEVLQVALLLLVVIALRYYRNLPNDVVFDGTAVVITGAGRGIGRRLALEFAKFAPVVLLDVDGDRLQSVASEIGNNPELQTCVHITCDVSDASAVRDALNIARTRLRIPLRILVSNAGIVNGKDCDALTAAEVSRTFNINVMATFNLLREMLPDMKAAKSGSILTVSSVMGMIGSARLGDYVASKWALLGLMESVRLELGRDGLYNKIGTVTLCPYHVGNTRLFQGVYDIEKDTPHGIIRSLCFPSLRDSDVCDAAVAAVRKGGHHVLILPAALGWIIGFFRFLLPIQLFDFFIGWCGGFHGMTSYKGVVEVIPSLIKQAAGNVLLGVGRGSGDGERLNSSRERSVSTSTTTTAVAPFSPTSRMPESIGSGTSGMLMMRMQSLLAEEEEEEEEEEKNKEGEGEGVGTGSVQAVRSPGTGKSSFKRRRPSMMG